MLPGDSRHAALAVRSRRRLLEVLESADEPRDLAALAAAVGLHVTTARVHLRVLEEAALVERAVDRSGRMGRPRQLFVAAEVPHRVVKVEASRDHDGYRQLATALAGALSVDPHVAISCAEEAGRRWAQDVVPVAEELSWGEANDRLAELFDRLGFAPRVVDGTGGRHLELDGCPFRELARAYPQVVCTVHRGLQRGALERWGSPAAQQAELRPFVESDLCITDLPAPPSTPEQPQP